MVWWGLLLEAAGRSCASGRASESVGEAQIDAFQTAGNANVK